MDSLGRAAGLCVSCCPDVKHDHHCDGGITTIRVHAHGMYCMLHSV
jgi:hypothetical protein